MQSFTTYRPTGRGYILKIRACFAKSSILIFTKSLGCDFSIRSQNAQVNSMQRSIKPPSEAKCLPRYLESQCYWIATEWRVFLLLYSVVILKGVLLERHYNHWALSLVQLYTQYLPQQFPPWQLVTYVHFVCNTYYLLVMNILLSLRLFVLYFVYDLLAHCHAMNHDRSTIMFCLLCCSNNND